jgi:multidrug efflux pump subunit AcrA (membrane-fusion protein)
MVPQSAVTVGRFGEFVAVIDKNNTAKVVWIKTGEKYKDLVEVFSDEIRSTDRVVIDGQINIFDGAKVNVVN